MSKQALGRGLESLIPKTEKPEEAFLLLETTRIAVNPYQPRKTFDAEKLEELAESFKTNGIIQPVVVRKSDEGYQLVAGERRLQAARLAGIAAIPAVIKQATDLQMLQMSIIENVQRDDLNPMEEAAAFDRLTAEFGLNREELAAAIGKSRTAVTNTIRLLKLPEEIQSEISEGRISRGHAIALLGLESEEEQAALCRKIIAEGLSVRATEALVKNGMRRSSEKPEKKQKPPEISAFEDKLQLLFGTRVNINMFKKGGKIEIEYYSDEDLNRIFEALNIRTH